MENYRYFVLIILQGIYCIQGFTEHQAMIKKYFTLFFSKLFDHLLKFSTKHDSQYTNLPVNSYFAKNTTYQCFLKYTK